jgi:hypothetical protein
MPSAQQLSRLANQLVNVFSRAEYSLKASGFNKGDGDAQANWRTFALAVEPLFANLQTPKMQAAVSYLLSNPPKKQIIQDGLIGWREWAPSTDSNADKILLYVRCVRNNLFHGGKYNGHWFEPERSATLLKHSIEIIKACIEFVPAVNEAYHG